MHEPDALIDARLAGTRAPAWVAAVDNEGIFGGVPSHCGCFAEATKVEPARPENFQKNESSSAKCSKNPHGWMYPGKLLYHESEVSSFVPDCYIR